MLEKNVEFLLLILYLAVGVKFAYPLYYGSVTHKRALSSLRSGEGEKIALFLLVVAIWPVKLIFG